MTKSANRALVDDSAEGVEPKEHVTSLRDVLVILANGVALQPAEKKLVLDYAEGLDKAED